ncbi:MAG: hypothetical protein BGN88_05810 [Clostridiales bacterium 43-6]|nr:MAG: hypothetical protein BGN88_05810 [Clostridiales bacterium 43-6]
MKSEFSCADCHTQGCKSGDCAKYPEFCLTETLGGDTNEAVVKRIKNSKRLSKILKTSAEVEGVFYGKLTRVEEVVEFYHRMGAKKVGIASCMGLMAETRLLTKIFDKRGIHYYTVCCKVGAIDKSEIGIPNEHKLNRGTGHESMCNPIVQAEALNLQKTDFNIIMGLCCGHDMVFTMHSKAPVTTLIVKDRVLCHNPVGALYTSEGIYSRFKD